jgi:hypothetical protein
MYFTINKLWKRKSDKEVCNSISIFAYTLAIIVHLPYMIKFAIIDGNYVPAMNDAINIIAYLFMIFIGTGFWVRENRHFSFKKVFYKALRLERKESADLVKSFIRPSGAKQIIKILQKIANLDSEVTKSEIDLIEKFAKNWELDINEIQPIDSTKQTSLLDIRQSVEEYLNTTPPIKQASELLDIIKLMINIDNTISEEEQVFLSEATIIINNYIKKDENIIHYEVLLVPQRKKKMLALQELYPNAEILDRRGGKVMVQGQYYSKEFAEAICHKFMDLGVFCTWEELETVKA